jgi:hypothetical protein
MTEPTTAPALPATPARMLLPAPVGPRPEPPGAWAA